MKTYSWTNEKTLEDGTKVTALRCDQNPKEVLIVKLDNQGEKTEEIVTNFRVYWANLK